MRRISIVLVILTLFALLVGCGEPTLETAKKAAEKYVKSANPSGEYTVGLNSEHNAVIITYTYDGYYLESDAISQNDLDWWEELSSKIVEVGQTAKMQMDSTGYIADCISYVTDSSHPGEPLLTVINGEITQDYLEGASDNTINLDKFNKIKSGMTYRQVCNIIGGEGQLSSSVDLDIGSEYVTEIYVWYASDGIGNALVTFQDGEVVSMAQAGLT